MLTSDDIFFFRSARRRWRWRLQIKGLGADGWLRRRRRSTRPPAAVVGATGNVGRELLSILAERKFPVDEVIALASSRSIGAEVSFGEDATLKVKNLADFDF